MPRNTFSQLPSSDELQNILEVEAKRSLPEGKVGRHYFEFFTLAKLLAHFGLDGQVLEEDLKPEDVTRGDILQRGKELIEQFKGKILGQELSAESLELLNAAYDYLSEEDKPEKSDIIFVFGAKTSLRIEKAVDLYKQGLADTILVSGKGPYYGENEQTEAERYSQIAIESGVPSERILMEDKSITIPDNVRASLNLLEQKDIRVSSIILVNSPYAQRRGWAHFKKHLPDEAKIIRVNCGTGVQYQRDTWYKNPVGIDVILGEYFKAKVAVSLDTA